MDTLVIAHYESKDEHLKQLIAKLGLMADAKLKLWCIISPVTPSANYLEALRVIAPFRMEEQYVIGVTSNSDTNLKGALDLIHHRRDICDVLVLITDQESYEFLVGKVLENDDNFKGSVDHGAAVFISYVPRLLEILKS